MDCEDGVGDIIHVLLISKKSSGRPEREHVFADLIATGARVLLALFLQPFRGEHALIDLGFEEVVHPWLLAQSVTDIGAKADPFCPDGLKERTAAGIVEMFFPIGHAVDVLGTATGSLVLLLRNSPRKVLQLRGQVRGVLVEAGETLLDTRELA